MHAELKLRDSVVMLGPSGAIKVSAPKPGDTSATLYLSSVEDVDKATKTSRECRRHCPAGTPDMLLGRSDRHRERSGWNKVDVGYPQVGTHPQEMEADEKG